MKLTRLLLPALSLSLLPTLLAQPNRVKARVDPGRMVALKGSTHPRALPENDEGPADPATRMSLMTVTLKQTPEQQRDLEQLLEEQRDPESPNYHKWLTPEEFADRFGSSRDDIDQIVGWLESQGLSVDNIARSRNWVVFSGTAAQVQSA